MFGIDLGQYWPHRRSWVTFNHLFSFLFFFLAFWCEPENLLDKFQKSCNTQSSIFYKSLCIELILFLPQVFCRIHQWSPSGPHVFFREVLKQWSQCVALMWCPLSHSCYSQFISSLLFILIINNLVTGLSVLLTFSKN